MRGRASSESGVAGTGLAWLLSSSNSSWLIVRKTRRGSSPGKLGVLSCVLINRSKSRQPLPKPIHRRRTHARTHARTRRRQLLVEPPGLAVVRLHRGDARPEAAGEGAPEVPFADRLVRLDHMRCDAHDGRLLQNARGHALLVHVDAFFRFLFLLLSMVLRGWRSDKGLDWSDARNNGHTQQTNTHAPTLQQLPGPGPPCGGRSCWPPRCASRPDTARRAGRGPRHPNPAASDSGSTPTGPTRPPPAKPCAGAAPRGPPRPPPRLAGSCSPAAARTLGPPPCTPRGCARPSAQVARRCLGGPRGRSRAWVCPQPPPPPGGRGAGLVLGSGKSRNQGP